MSYTTPQLDAAAAVAEMLTGREIAGFTIAASADELLPTGEMNAGDFRELRVECVPAEEYELESQDRDAADEQCPVNIGVRLACGKENQSLYRQLLALLRGIAKAVKHVSLEGFGLPRETITVRDSTAHLEQGLFYGVVIANYYKQTGPDE